MNKFSVLMSLYSKEKSEYLILCLRSLLEQTLKPDEVIIVFDGEVGDILESVVHEYSDDLNIIIVRLSSNVGLGGALNEGLKYCSYDYVARMDTDDICMPNRFEMQMSVIVESKVDILGCNANVIDSGGSVIGNRINPLEDFNIKKVLWCNPVIHPSVVFYKQAIMSLGGYNANLRRRQDYDLWFRAALVGLKFKNMPEKLIEYREFEYMTKKQTPKLAFQQGVIGFKGSRKLGHNIFSSFACFFPFIKSLLPTYFQVSLLRIFKRFDPRSI